MERQKVKVIFTIFLGIIFLIVLINSFRKISKRKSEITSTSFELAKKNLSRKKEIFNKLESLSYKRDPFNRVVISNLRDSQGFLVLKGILWDRKFPQAIFGDRLLKPGERVNSYQILEIKRDSVILTDGKLNYELFIGQSINELR